MKYSHLRSLIRTLVCNISDFATKPCYLKKQCWVLSAMLIEGLIDHGTEQQKDSNWLEWCCQHQFYYKHGKELICSVKTPRFGTQVCSIILEKYVIQRNSFYCGNDGTFITHMSQLWNRFVIFKTPIDNSSWSAQDVLDSCPDLATSAVKDGSLIINIRPNKGVAFW